MQIMKEGSWLMSILHRQMLSEVIMLKKRIEVMFNLEIIGVILLQPLHPVVILAEIHKHNN